MHFGILCEFFPISSCFIATVATFWKHLSSLLGFIVAFLFFIQSRFRFTLVMKEINAIKDKITTFHWCFQPNEEVIQKVIRQLYLLYHKSYHIHIRYNCCYKNYLPLLVWFFLFKSFLISLTIPSLIALIILSSDCFSIFDFLDFIWPSYKLLTRVGLQYFLVVFLL